MSAYTNLDGWCRRMPATEAYQTTAPIIWCVGRKGSALFVRVPEGAIFDVSVPWFLRWVIDAHDRRFLKAAALHDWLLRDGWDRVTAGAIFHDALGADGVAGIERFAMWLAVSIFAKDSVR